MRNPIYIVPDNKFNLKRYKYKKCAIKYANKLQSAVFIPYPTENLMIYSHKDQIN